MRRNAYQKLQLGDKGGHRDSQRVVCIFGRNNGPRARRITNEQELKQKVESMGYRFIAVRFDGSTPEQSVESVHPCDVAIGIHGANLANWAFMRPGGLAVQIVPYGLSNGFIGSYEDIARVAGLRYIEWTADQSFSHPIWDQLTWSDDELKKAVCNYGVEKLKREGNNGNDFLSWAFFVNQEVDVPVDVVATWLSSAPTGVSAMQTRPLEESAGNTNVYGAGALGSRLAARVQQLVDLVKQMTLEEAKLFCASFLKASSTL